MTAIVVLQIDVLVMNWTQNADAMQRPLFEVYSSMQK